MAAMVETASAAPTRGGPMAVLREMSRNKVIWYLPVIMMGVSGAAISMPFVPNISTNFFASQRAQHKVDCTTFTHANQPEACINAHGDAALWQASTSFMSSSVMCFLVAPTVGAATDVYGRKPFLVMSTIMSILPILTLVLYTNLNLISLYWYYPVVAFNGGLNPIAITLAAIADSVSAENRTVAFGMVIATSCLGFIFGPILGTLAQTAETALNVALLVLILNVVFAMIVLKETLPTVQNTGADHAELETPLMSGESDESEAPFKAKSKSGWVALSILGRSSLFRRLSVLIMSYMMVEAGVQGFIGQYLLLTLDFQTGDQAMMFVALGVCGIVVQFFLLGPLIKLLGEKKLIVFGLVMQIIQQIAVALSFSKVEAICAVSIGSLGMVTFPAISSLKSNGVAANEQGQIQGALYGVQALAMGLGPLLFSAIFTAFTRAHSILPYLPAAPFFIGSVLLLIPLGVAIEMCLAETRNSSESRGFAPSESRA